MTLNLEYYANNAQSPPGDIELWVQDVDLARACIAGDQRAQRRFYDKYYSLVLGICKRYAGPTIEESDLLSLAFVHAFKKLDKYSGQGSLGGWLRTLSVRSCLTAVRNQARHQYREIESSEIEIALPAKVISQLAMEDL
ncbi:MAG: sigma-70 family RNA polymerase sigma factor, partial [Bacteroidota bacterium]